MRFVAIFISTVMLVYLIYSFIVAQQSEEKVALVMNPPKSVIPAYISDTPLLVEQVWQQLKSDRVKAKQPVDKKEDDPLKNKDVLTIGDNKYALYGIFNGSNKAGSKKHSEQTNQAFILIKALVKEESSKNLMQKVIAGQELSKGITLVAVTSNSISFKQNKALIEFKLFEAKQ